MKEERQGSAQGGSVLGRCSSYTNLNNMAKERKEPTLGLPFSEVSLSFKGVLERGS